MNAKLKKNMYAKLKKNVCKTKIKYVYKTKNKKTQMSLLCHRNFVIWTQFLDISSGKINETFIT
jgi:hypothetical protein